MASIEDDKNIDRISNLPEDIIVDQILSRLSMKDAVRTSILSRKWRYSWVTLPSLVFNDEVDYVSSHPDYGQDTLVRMIDSVLSLHTGPLHKIKLVVELEGISDIIVDRWLTYLSRGSLKEFYLYLSESIAYEIPSSIYLLQKLTNLEVSRCYLDPPPEFNGFKCLKWLFLHYVTMKEVGFEQMILKCPLLESLSMFVCEGFLSLKIHAPNLRFLDVDSAFDDIILVDTFNLVVVTITQDSLRILDSGGLVNFVSCLPRIQRLLMLGVFWKNLTIETFPRKLSTCPDLTYIAIDINLNYRKQNLCSLCLLRSSPNLKELTLQLLPEQQEFAHMQLLPEQQELAEDIIDVENFERLSLNQLRFIKIVGISSTRRELNFIKLLLENAPVLERMTVQTYSRESGCDLVKELLGFGRASTSAEIIDLSEPLA